MHNRSFWGPLVVLLLVLAASAAVGVGAYNAGVSHGFAEAGRTVAVPVEGAARVYVWPGPWGGHGYGYFPFFPIVAFVFVLLLFRGLFARRAWHGRCGNGHDGVPPAFEEWHRRAHERQASPPAPDKTA